MLKREHIKQALDAVTRCAPEIGYTLDELFATGQIDALPAHLMMSPQGDYLFKFQDQTATVRRFAFFNEGTAPIEQQLLIHYGRLLQKQSIEERGGTIRYREAAEQTDHAGFEFVVAYEIDQARRTIERGIPEKCKDADIQAMKCLARLKAQRSGFHEPIPGAIIHAAHQIHFRGLLGNDQSALFATFPLCRQALVQLAELNLEFFQVRRVLSAMLRGQTDRLFACLVGGYLAGLVLVGPRNRRTGRALEIRYIASARERLPGLPLQALRGVGSFLVAGTWFYWKTSVAGFRELVLDSEIGAMGFYEAIGFEQHRRFFYKLAGPKGQLLDSLVRMAEFCPDLKPAILTEIAAELRRQIRIMAGRSPEMQDRSILRAIRHSLLSRRHALLARTAAEELVRQRSHIPQAEELLRIGVEIGRLRFKETSSDPTARILILQDAVFAEHLKSVFHMESARRLDAVRAALNHPSLTGRWIAIHPRAASEDELNWVHSRPYIAAIAATAGKTIHSLDLDTQTTAKSFETACLAVGGVFALLDAVWAGEHACGFAFVRPPGHHAEPDRAMGFCLFNNVALAARYLENIYGLEKIMIVDIDAHHGNGTQKIFYHTAAVLFASLHQFPGYPGSGHLNEVGADAGEGFTVNIPLPKGSRDADFAQAVYSIIRPIAQQYEPEALLVSCGFDLYQHDRLAGMHGTSEGYALMTFFLKELADQLCGGRIVYVLEGGYHPAGIETCALRTMQELAGIGTLPADRIARIRANDPKKFPPLRKVIDIQKRYWTLT
jgi:acetoin utilization deacetylase AcuC-like enzyme